MKIQGQGHGWGQSWKSQHGSNIQSTHIPFIPCGSGIPLLSYDFFKIWPWKSRVKVMGEVTVQSHNVGLTSYRLTSLSFHVKRASHCWVTTFLKIWPWKSRVKVMVGVTVQSHNLGPTSYRFTSLSFHVNWPSHSWDTVFSKFDLENQGSRSNDHDVAQLQVQTILQNFEWYRSIQGFQRYGLRKVWPKCCLIWQVFGPWASPYEANGQITMTVHNYRSRQVHETLNGVNPFSGFRDMSSAKSGPNLCQIWQVLGPWASPYGANGQMTMTVHNYRPRQFHRTSNGENPSSGYRDMGSASLAAARPDRDDNTPPARRAEE